MYVSNHDGSQFGRRLHAGRMAARRSNGPGATIVMFSGDVDVTAVEAFGEAIDDGVALAIETLIIEMRGVDFLGIAGARALAAGQVHANCNGLELLLVPGGRTVTRPLAVTGLLDRFRCFPSIRAAVEERESELAAHEGLDIAVTSRPMEGRRTDVLER